MIACAELSCIVDAGLLSASWHDIDHVGMLDLHA